VTSNSTEIKPNSQNRIKQAEKQGREKRKPQNKTSIKIKTCQRKQRETWTQRQTETGI